MPYNLAGDLCSKLSLRPITLSTDRRVKEWVACICTDSIIVGKIDSKLSLTQCLIVHWALVRGTRNQLVSCSGCSLTDHVDLNGYCVIKMSSLKYQLLR